MSIKKKDRYHFSKTHRLFMAVCTTLIFLSAGLSDCKSKISDDGPRGVQVFQEEPFPAKLSAWQLFSGDIARLQPNKGVVPYDLNTPLFTDYARKFRTIYIPGGQAAQYHEKDAFTFPVGTVISKTFFYKKGEARPASAKEFARGDRAKENWLLETRILVHTPTGWAALPYIWNEEQTEAELSIAGGARELAYKRSKRSKQAGETIKIDYQVPDANQCKGCHALQVTPTEEVFSPIGPRARHLNRDYEYPEGKTNQLAYLTKVGYLKGAPGDPARAPKIVPWDEPQSGSLEQRARGYLDANCAHCHNPVGPGRTSALLLEAYRAKPTAWGLCKTPVAAGRGAGNLDFDIVPGKAHESILFYRLNSVDPGIMMPELGRSVIDTEGLALVKDWINSLPPEKCVVE